MLTLLPWYGLLPVVSAPRNSKCQVKGATTYSMLALTTDKPGQDTLSSLRDEALSRMSDISCLQLSYPVGSLDLLCRGWCLASFLPGTLKAQTALTEGEFAPGLCRCQAMPHGLCPCVPASAKPCCLPSSQMQLCHFHSTLLQSRQKPWPCPAIFFRRNFKSSLAR